MAASVSGWLVLDGHFRLEHALMARRSAASGASQGLADDSLRRAEKKPAAPLAGSALVGGKQQPSAGREEVHQTRKGITITTVGNTGLSRRHDG